MKVSYLEDVDEVEIVDEPYFEVLVSGLKYTDPVSETHRRVENIALGRRLIKDFRRFDFEARNGFQDLSQNEQLEVISNRKREARGDLQDGSLFPYEKMELTEMVNERVERIYRPFVKWARKKAS